MFVALAPAGAVSNLMAQSYTALDPKFQHKIHLSVSNAAILAARDFRQAADTGRLTVRHADRFNMAAATFLKVMDEEGANDYVSSLILASGVPPALTPSASGAAQAIHLLAQQGIAVSVADLVAPAG